MSFSPKKIKREVVEQLYWDERIDASEIKVETSNNKVELSGSVPSYTAKTRAEDTAWSIRGVINVDNQLTVVYPPQLSVPADKEIKSNIENSLTWNIDIDATKIDVEVKNNVVTLSGTSDSYWKKYRAEELADVTGVYRIINNIAVAPTEKVDDEQIAKNVAQALDRNLIVNEDKVEVKVEEGKVTLTGTASSWTEFRSAEESAYLTLGVKDIDNQISIKY